MIGRTRLHLSNCITRKRSCSALFDLAVVAWQGLTTLKPLIFSTATSAGKRGKVEKRYERRDLNPPFERADQRYFAVTLIVLRIFSP